MVIVRTFCHKYIATTFEESFTLKKQSEQLIETAKRAVEIVVEQNEEAALAYIEGATLLYNTDIRTGTSLMYDEVHYRCTLKYISNIPGVTLLMYPQVDNYPEKVELLYAHHLY